MYEAMGTHALLVGVSRFSDPELSALNAPESDVVAFAAVLRDAAQGGFDEVEISVNEDLGIVRDKLVSLFEERRPRDMVLFYYSGHGIVGSDNQLFLATCDTKKERPRARSLVATEIRDIMENSRAGRLVVILDCCHSGAFADRAKGAAPVSAQTFSAGEGVEGQYVLMATNELQYALDADDKPTGAAIAPSSLSRFTSWLIDGLANGEAAPERPEITMDDLFHYVSRRARETRESTRRMIPQRFVKRNSGIITIARNPMVRGAATMESRVLAAMEAVRICFASGRQMKPPELQRLALPLKRCARDLTDFGIIDQLLSNFGNQATRDAAVFSAAVILYERTPKTHFNQLLGIVMEPGPLRGACIWRLLRAVRRYLVDTDLSEQQRIGLIEALHRYAQTHDQKPGKRFDNERVLSLVYDISKHKRMKLDKRLDTIFSPDQLAELAAIVAKRRPIATAPGVLNEK